MIDLTNKRAVIFGLPGTGKSLLLEHILKSTRKHIIYDPLNEHGPKDGSQGFTRYVPTDRHSADELNTFIEKGVIARRNDYDLLAIDEMNIYVRPKPTPLPRAVADLNDMSRHFLLSWLGVARRPSQFHTDIVELAHFVFLFKLPGANDYRYMESLSKGLGDTVRALPKYHFAILEDGVRVTVHTPVNINV